MIDRDRLERTLTRVVGMLVSGDYAGLEAITGGNRLPANEIEEAIHQYGRTVELPPNGRIEDADVVAVEGSDPQRWSVWLRLWTAEEGRSDLTLETTVVDSDRPEYLVEIDNLEVP